ncbi:MAG: hypothetical protein AAGC55_32800, partial [Myxococcota bacterium]
QIALAQARESLPHHFLKVLASPRGEDSALAERALAPHGRLAQLRLIERVSVPLAEDGGYRIAAAVLDHVRERPRQLEPQLAAAVHVAASMDIGGASDGDRGAAGGADRGGAGASVPWVPELGTVGWDGEAAIAERVALAGAGAGRPLVAFAPRGWGALTLARHLARERGLALVHLDFDQLPERTPPGAALAAARREARLAGAVLYIDGVEVLPQGDAEAVSRVAALLGQLAGAPYPRIIRLGLSVSRTLAGALIEGGGGIPVTLPPLSPDARKSLWQRALDHYGIELGDGLVFLVRAYNLGVEQIDRAARLALGLARRRDLDAPRVVGQAMARDGRSVADIAGYVGVHERTAKRYKAAVRREPEPDPQQPLDLRPP